MIRRIKIISHRLTLLLLLFPVLVGAQQPASESPLYHEDGSVTFVVNSPESRHVRVYCDCDLWHRRYNIIRDKMYSARMIPDHNGQFTFTTPPLAPEVYTYQFKSHGQKLADPHNADSIRISKGKRSVFVISGSHLTDLCLTDSLSGKTEQCEFWDSACGKSRRILLYLPPGYDSTGQTYPVLYLLHGINGNEQSWIDRGRVLQQVDNLIRQGKARPMIVVMPDANPNQLVGQKENVGLMRNLLHYHSWSYQDFEQIFPKMDSFLSTRYSISSDMNLRAVAGLSAGGTQTATLAVLCQDNFKYAGLFSPVVHRKQWPVSSNTFYWVGTGKSDIFHWQSKRLARNLRQQEIPHLYFETHGGHTWRNWRLYLSEFLQLIFKETEKETEDVLEDGLSAKETRLFHDEF